MDINQHGGNLRAEAGSSDKSEWVVLKFFDRNDTQVGSFTWFPRRPGLAARLAFAINFTVAQADQPAVMAEAAE